MAIYTHHETAHSPFTTDPWWVAMGTTYASATSSLITIYNLDLTVTKVYGTFSVINGNVVGGVIGSVERTDELNGTIYETITGLSKNVMPFLALEFENRLHFLFDGTDQFYGYSGDDTVWGGAGQDLMVGGTGYDKLMGADGDADKMIGGPGNDTYWADAIDIITELPDAGFDTWEVPMTTPVTLPDNVERLRIFFDNSHGTGNGLDNHFEINAHFGQFYGLEGEDTFFAYGSSNKLYGGADDDEFNDYGWANEMHGGLGDDLYKSPIGPVIEHVDEGYDAVWTTASTCTLAENVELLQFQGLGDHVGYGNAGDNPIRGSGGQDILHGLGGDDNLSGFGGGDELYGGTGDDLYDLYANEIDTKVIELANEGIDTVWTGLATYTLPDNVENLITVHIGIGNALDNDIDSTGGAELRGLGGNDTLRVHLQDAVIDGGEGEDTAVFTGNLADWSVLDRGDKVVLARGSQQVSVVATEHLQFKDGTIHFNDGNALFDTLYYMKQNPDVFHAGVNALDHYNAFGWHEGRDPSAFFDTSAYLAANPDVAASGMNPLDHYHQDGWKEGRDAGPKFDTTRYLLNNPDVAAAGIDPLAHFLQFGMSEGRASYRAIGSHIVNGFDAQFYLFNNPDVAAAGVDPLAHYNADGWHEGRDPNGWFDSDGYLATYGDVAAAGVNPLDHYMAFGWQEGRDASTMFDTAGYLAANPDVAAAHVNPLDHFLQFGIYEGRHAVNDGMWG
jgi:Ca2+-binding RTX toxin-like protein